MGQSRVKQLAWTVAMALVGGAILVGLACTVDFQSGPSPCEDDACSGHGSCAVEDGQAVCTCYPGYSGDHCEEDNRDAGVEPDAAVDAATTPCTAADDGCSNNTLALCNLSNGQLETNPCPLGCATSELRCLSFVPSNVAPDVLDEGASDIVVASDVTVDTSDCDGPFGDPLVVLQSDGGELCVIRTGEFHLMGQARLTVMGNRPLVLLAAGPLWIEGIVDASADTTSPGPGGARGGRPGHSDGNGNFPGRDGANVGDFQDGGGGGGGMCGVGGVGGVGQSASGGQGGGTVDASWELSPLHGGSGGGLGHGTYDGTVDNVGRGGAGGGALQLSSAVSITVDGAVVAGGGGGRGGTNHFPGLFDFGAGGGGGSGGAILIEAPEVILGPTCGLGVSGGGGGGGASNIIPPEFDGSNGGLLSAAGGPSGGDPYGAPGGDGSDAVVLAGAVGGSNSSADANGGGGGGGAGCILLRNGDGQLPTTGGTTNPEVAPGLRALLAHRE